MVDGRVIHRMAENAEVAGNIFRRGKIGLKAPAKPDYGIGFQSRSSIFREKHGRACSVLWPHLVSGFQPSDCCGRVPGPSAQAGICRAFSAGGVGAGTSGPSGLAGMGCDA